MCMSPIPINICLVDDHTIFRQGLRQLLRTFDRIHSIWEAENGYEFVQNLRHHPTDVVLLDLRMPVMDGRQVCEYMEKHEPDVRILILSMEDNVLMFDSDLTLSVHGYLTKTCEAAELESAINHVFDHGFYFNREAVQAFHTHRRLAPPREDGPWLTEREIEIVRLICEEFTMREIADRLNISEKTVQNHRSKVMEKLGATNTAGLVRSAFRYGIVF